MEMTQGFLVIGRNPGLFVLGEPTHDRDDLDEEGRNKPDPDRIEVLIIPPGMGLILKKGTWHDFPVSCGPPVSAFIINSEEVVEALASMKEPAPMNHGDCFKLRLSEHFPVTFKFRDPRPYVKAMGLVTESEAKEPTSSQDESGDKFSLSLLSSSRILPIAATSVVALVAGYTISSMRK